MSEHEPTIAEVMGTATKRRRGRPPRTVMAGVDESESPDDKPQRRSRKLTADDVTQMVTGGFDLLAMVRGPHWRVNPDEVKPWAKNAADLANSVPSRYGKAFVQMNGYAMIAVGMYAIVAPRLVTDRVIREQVTGVQNGTTTPEDANAVLTEEYARWPGPKTN